MNPEINTGMVESIADSEGDLGLSPPIKFSRWSSSVLKAALMQVNYIAAGGFYYPPEDTSSHIPIEIDTLVGNVCLEQTIQIATLCSTVQSMSLDISGEQVILSRIIPGGICLIREIGGAAIGSSIGVLWVLSNTENQDQLSRRLMAAAHTIERRSAGNYAIECLRKLASGKSADEIKTRELVASLARQSLEILNCNGVIIWSVEPSQKLLATWECLGFVESVESLDLAMGKGVAGLVAVSGRPVLVMDIQDDIEMGRLGGTGTAVVHKKFVERNDLHGAIFTPVKIESRIAFVISALSRRRGSFTALHQALIDAVVQQFISSYTSVRRIEEMIDLEAKVHRVASAVEAGMLAIEKVHDADNDLAIAQARLSDISLLLNSTKGRVHDLALAASLRVDSAHKLLKKLVRVGGRPKKKIEPIKLLEAVQEVVEAVDLETRNLGIKVRNQCDPVILLPVDREELHRVFRNLMNNSIYFLEIDRKGAGRLVTITAQREADGVDIRFRDNGPGIAPHDIGRVFDYFYSTKGDKGTGFGLSIVRGILRSYNARIEASSKWGYWTEFKIKFPY